MTEEMTAEEYRQIIADQPRKYRNKPTDYNGVRYHSKAEARFAADLDILQKHGAVAHWLRQVPFDLPGGTVHRVDFLVFYPPVEGEPLGHWELIEVKGRETPIGALKRRQVQEIYGVTIRVVK